MPPPSAVTNSPLVLMNTEPSELVCAPTVEPCGSARKRYSVFAIVDAGGGARAPWDAKNAAQSLRSSAREAARQPSLNSRTYWDGVAWGSAGGGTGLNES